MVQCVKNPNFVSEFQKDARTARLFITLEEYNRLYSNTKDRNCSP